MKSEGLDIDTENPGGKSGFAPKKWVVVKIMVLLGVPLIVGAVL